MRHNHKELIRDEMHSSDKYCHDLAAISIADIYALIQYNRAYTEGKDPDDPRFQRHRYNLKELSEYMYEYNERLANRTAGFDKRQV